MIGIKETFDPTTAVTPPYRLHGLSASYFTGKLEAYMRAKGLDYTFVEMDTADFRACAQATGIAQMPQLEGGNGQWLTDTTDIIRHFEAQPSGPALSPVDPVTRFFSLLLEDFGDEWLWRPAMYYRWAFKEDAALMGARLASTLLRDLPLPHFFRAGMIRRRQQRLFLGKNGIRPATREQVEVLYHRTLAALDDIFSKRAFMFGARPVEADFGMFGSMFRHFSIDPTAAAIMRREAPRVLEWTARMWALGPDAITHAPLPEDVALDLQPLIDLCAEEYLPYLEANADAYQHGKAMATYVQEGVSWSVPVNPYCVRCLNDLRGHFAALDADARGRVSARMGAGSATLKQSQIVLEIAPGKNAHWLTHHLD